MAKYADSRKLFDVLHTDSTESWVKQKPFSPYPDVTFILAHAGSSYAVAEECVRWLRQGNVVLELTYQTLTRASWEYLVREVGADKFYMTDLAGWRSVAAAWVGSLIAQISEEDKAKILHGNIQRLLALRKANLKKTAY